MSIDSNTGNSGNNNNNNNIGMWTTIVKFCAAGSGTPVVSSSTAESTTFYSKLVQGIAVGAFLSWLAADIVIVAKGDQESDDCDAMVRAVVPSHTIVLAAILVVQVGVRIANFWLDDGYQAAAVTMRRNLVFATSMTKTAFFIHWLFSLIVAATVSSASCSDRMGDYILWGIVVGGAAFVLVGSALSFMSTSAASKQQVSAAAEQQQLNTGAAANRV